jgi:hypothetical protein
MAGTGALATFSPAALSRLGHFADLWPLVAPLGAYSRHVDVGEGLGGPVQAGYAALFLVLYAAVVVGLAVIGVVERRPAWIALAVVPIVLTLLAVVTPFTMHVHHILGMKPFVYAGAAVLGARAAARPRWRTAVLALWVLLLTGSLLANVRAFADMRSAEPLRGTYGVGWNAVHAWQAAVASDVGDVRALDWGVFFAGIVASRPDQRWDMASVANEAALARLLAGADRVGLLFRAAGPHAWLRTQTTHPILAERVLDGEPGDAWVFLVVSRRDGRD